MGADNNTGTDQNVLALGQLYEEFKQQLDLDCWNKIENWEESSKKIGQLVHWKVSCSSMGASGTECVSHIKFGKGIDKNKEIIELAESFSIVEKSGAWYSLDFLAGTDEFEEAPKFHGQENLYKFLESRPDVFKLVLDKVQSVLE